jgi:hypothetical protein
MCGFFCKGTVLYVPYKLLDNHRFLLVSAMIHFTRYDTVVKDYLTKPRFFKDFSKEDYLGTRNRYFLKKGYVIMFLD